MSMKKIALALVLAVACMVPGLAYAAESADGNAGLVAGQDTLQPQSVRAQADPATIDDGMYTICLASNSDCALSVSGASIKKGANVLLDDAGSSNGQKFVVHAVGDGYVRIGSSLGSTTVALEDNSASGSANVCMEKYSGADTQLWRAEVAGAGIRFVNKASGKALAAKKASVGANVAQADPSEAPLQVWQVTTTSLNLRDRNSYLNVIKAASKSKSVVLSNKVAGYTVDKKKWKNLLSAVRSCQRSFNIRFIMVDCSTGMTVTCNPNQSWYAASTIKGLYATYLFEDCLETGELSKSQVQNLMRRTVVASENEAYFSLRARFGTQSGFNKWLKAVGIGPKGVWTSYSPSTLAKAWTRMMAYSNSNGKYVKYWKQTFSHGYRSAVRMALSKKRTVYSKPGWNKGLQGEPTRYHDGSLVIDKEGRHYLIAFMSNGHPDYSKAAVMRMVKALDAVHMDMPAMR